MQRLVLTLTVIGLLSFTFGAKAQDANVEENIFPIETTETEEAVEEEEDEEKPKFLLSGSADAYFRVSPEDQAPASSFANQPGFSLGMFNLIGTHEGKKAGFVGDLVFGPRGGDAVFASGVETLGGVAANASTFVNQLYVYYNASDAVTLTLGNFNTFLGYEVISPVGNFNYSTSYMFSYGPFSHTGLKADIALDEDLSLMVGVFNPTDLTETNTIGSYSVGAQLGYKGVYLNLLYGDQDGEEGMGALFQADITAGFDVSEDWYVGVNATINRTDPDAESVDTPTFFGAAGYLQYTLSDAVALGFRGEYFGESNGGYGIIGAYDTDLSASIIDLTLSANITLGDLRIIPELRLDTASEDIFLDGDGKASSSLASFVLAGVYAF